MAKRDTNEFAVYTVPMCIVYGAENTRRGTKRGAAQQPRAATSRSNLAQQRCIIVAANYPCFCTRATRAGIDNVATRPIFILEQRFLESLLQRNNR